MEKDIQDILLAEHIVRLERLVREDNISLPATDSEFLRTVIFNDIMGKNNGIPSDLIVCVRKEFPALVQDIQQGIIDNKIVAPPRRPKMKKVYQ